MERIEIEKIIKNKTVKKTNKFAKQKLKLSVERYGQIYPIIVDENNIIIKGNSLYDCLLENNETLIFIHRIEGVKNKELLNIELSKLQSSVDFKYLLSSLDDIDLHDTLLPISNEKLSAIKKLLEFNWDKYNNRVKDIPRLF